MVGFIFATRVTNLTIYHNLFGHVSSIDVVSRHIWSLIIDKIFSHLLKLDIKLKEQTKWSINYHMYYNLKKNQICWNVDIDQEAFTRHFATSCINIDLWRIMWNIAHLSITSNQQITFEVKNIQLLLHQLNNNFMKP